jgi:osmotically-inducible protein OsmY
MIDRWLEDFGMSFSFKKKTLTVLCAGALGLGAAATQAAVRQSETESDAQLRERVQAALHDDPYFYDAHVDVSVEDGNVVLRGLVFGDWDLRDAMRIAGKAAGSRRVIDDLSIVTGGRR